MPCLLRKQNPALQPVLIKPCETLQKAFAALSECVNNAGEWGGVCG